MADKRTGPGEAARRGKRAAPTIDLSATDVTPAPAASEAAPEPPAEPPPTDKGATDDESRQAPGRLFSGPALAAGIAGAAFTAILLFALWLTGMVPIRYAGSTAMRARVSGLEMQVHDLQRRPPAALNSEALDAIGQRVSKIEDTLAKLSANDPSLNERVTATDNAIKALSAALSALNRRNDDITITTAQARERAEAAEKAVSELRASLQDAARSAAPGISASELDAVQKRVAALEQSARTARDDIAKNAAADDTTRLAMAAAALRDAVESGTPFAAELAQARSLGADDKMITPLAAFASSGVPSAQALAQDLRALLPALVKDAQPSGNFLERLQANAGKLVRIRPVDAPPGDDPSTVLARLEVAAAKADIPAAIADLGRLINPDMPDTVRSTSQLWINKAKAREAARATSRQFAADAARTLGRR